MPHHRRRRRRSCLLSMAGGVSVGALLFFAGRRSSPAIGIWQLQQQQGFFPPPELLRSPPPELLLSESPARQESQADLSFARRLLPVRRQAPPPQLLEDDAVLLPDEEVLVLAAEPPVGNAMCVFPGEGASSPARALGRLPGPGRHAYVCVMPRLLLPSSPSPAPAAAHLLDSAQQLQAPPRLLPSSPAPTAHLLDRLLPSSPAPASAADCTLLSWSDNKLVFHSAPLGGGDVLVFAKGSRQGINMSPGDVQCLYSGATMVDASFPAITSTQQVTRCPSPPQSLSYCRVTLVLRGQETLPSIATYVPNHSGLSVTHDKKLICACTMVRNVAKFISEWVRYHAGIGIDHFYLYDNGSEDDLADQVAKLNAAGFKVLTVAWPWTKTQEAGFSHCAAVYRSSCHWMAFVDVDEFVFSPKWHIFDNPSKSMLEEVVSVDPQVGQIYLACYDFGPSGQTAHPSEGVCQGYICRIEKRERHKSLVRLDAVDDSLKNSIHHFQLKAGFDSKWTWLARVNHYKYQAWPEFKHKFKRRVSTYVTDWKDRANLQSGDRAPGLGVEAIEPEGGWAGRYCERNDTDMKDTSIKWFGVGLGGRGTGHCFGCFQGVFIVLILNHLDSPRSSQDRKIVSAGTDIVILFLNQDPNLLRSYIVQQEGNSLLALLHKLSHCLSSRFLRRWCMSEWFYSETDYPWFAKSEFVEYLNHVKLGHVPRLTRVEWGVIRSSLGKPRRLSKQFLHEEREKLSQYRESVRQHYAELQSGVREGLPTDLARPLAVGQRIIACHPKTRELHDGSVFGC